MTTIGKSLIPAIETQIAGLKRQIGELESGRMRLQERSDGPWRDITQEQADHIKTVVAELERVRDELKNA